MTIRDEYTGKGTKQQRYRARHRSKEAAAAKVKKETRRQRHRRLKESQPCADCGKFFPYWVMEWDHLRDKEFNISALAPVVSTARLDAEIEKCDLLCVNCHRHRTFCRRMGVDWYPLDGLD